MEALKKEELNAEPIELVILNLHDGFTTEGVIK